MAPMRPPTSADSEPVSFDVPSPAHPFEATIDDDAITVEVPAPVFPRDPPPQQHEIVSFELQPADEDLSFELPRPDERRVKRREVIRVQARITYAADEPPLDAHTIDLSAHGVAITANRPLNVGHECVVELGVSVPEIATPPTLRACVRYCAQLSEKQFRIGMKFTAVSIEAAELIVAVLEL